MNMKTDTKTTLFTKPVETVHTHAPIVICDGNNPVFGHPRVFLKLKDGQATCPYCSKSFILDANV